MSKRKIVQNSDKDEHEDEDTDVINKTKRRRMNTPPPPLSNLDMPFPFVPISSSSSSSSSPLNTMIPRHTEEEKNMDMANHNVQEALAALFLLSYVKTIDHLPTPNKESQTNPSCTSLEMDKTPTSSSSTPPTQCMTAEMLNSLKRSLLECNGCITGSSMIWATLASSIICKSKQSSSASSSSSSSSSSSFSILSKEMLLEIKQGISWMPGDVDIFYTPKADDIDLSPSLDKWIKQYGFKENVVEADKKTYVKAMEVICRPCAPRMRFLSASSDADNVSIEAEKRSIEAHNGLINDESFTLHNYTHPNYHIKVQIIRLSPNVDVTRCVNNFDYSECGMVWPLQKDLEYHNLLQDNINKKILTTTETIVYLSQKRRQRYLLRGFEIIPSMEIWWNMENKYILENVDMKLMPTKESIALAQKLLTISRQPDSFEADGTLLRYAQESKNKKACINDIQVNILYDILREYAFHVIKRKQKTNFHDDNDQFMNRLRSGWWIICGLEIAKLFSKYKSALLPLETLLKIQILSNVQHKLCISKNSLGKYNWTVSKPPIIVLWEWMQIFVRTSEYERGQLYHYVLDGTDTDITDVYESFKNKKHLDYSSYSIADCLC
jgi:hypothetical protein